MLVTKEQQFTPDWFSKPGDSLLLLMRRQHMTAQDVAGKLDGGMATMRGILSGSIAIDKHLANTLTNVVGGTSDFWLRRQANYEEALERAAVSAAKSEADVWLDRVPLTGTKP